MPLQTGLGLKQKVRHLKVRHDSAHNHSNLTPLQPTKRTVCQLFHHQQANLHLANLTVQLQGVLDGLSRVTQACSEEESSQLFKRSPKLSENTFCRTQLTVCVELSRKPILLYLGPTYTCVWPPSTNEWNTRCIHITVLVVNQRRKGINKRSSQLCSTFCSFSFMQVCHV